MSFFRLNHSFLKIYSVIQFLKPYLAQRIIKNILHCYYLTLCLLYVVPFIEDGTFDILTILLILFS